MISSTAISSVEENYSYETGSTFSAGCVRANILWITSEGVDKVKAGSDEESRSEISHDNLRFRRQFLLTSIICTSLKHWEHRTLNHYQLYVHRDVEVNIVQRGYKDRKAALIGYMIDPLHPDRSNAEILRDILKTTQAVESLSRYLHSISGRFVLILLTADDTYVFHDPCGLRSVYYSEYKGGIVIGSQPLIFKHVMPLKEQNRFYSYEKSTYKKGNMEHWLPSGTSLYESVYHLIPNHYLQVSCLKQIRYWPNEKLRSRRLDDVPYEASELLRKLIQAGHQRFDLALPLTAGLDSRVLLSASKAIADDTYFYTLQYRTLQAESDDIAIPRKLLKKLGLTHHLIDCRIAPDKEFLQIYDRNTSMAHKEDWGNIAYGMYGRYPQDIVCVKGNCSEIARCFYYKNGTHLPIASVQKLIEVERGWNTLPFICAQLTDWYSGASVAAKETGVDILDLFYWEHRMGSWQAQSQLEWDIIQEAYTPFNHRELLEMMLGISTEFRRAPNYLLFNNVIEALWPECLSEPINPPRTAKDKIKRLLFRLGLVDATQKLHKAIVQ